MIDEEISACLATYGHNFGLTQDGFFGFVILRFAQDDRRGDRDQCRLQFGRNELRPYISRCSAGVSGLFDGDGALTADTEDGWRYALRIEPGVEIEIGDKQFGGDR